MQRSVSEVIRSIQAMEGAGVPIRRVFRRPRLKMWIRSCCWTIWVRSSSGLDNPRASPTTRIEDSRQ